MEQMRMSCFRSEPWSKTWVWQDFSRETGEGSWPHEPLSLLVLGLEPRWLSLSCTARPRTLSITGLRGRGFSKAFSRKVIPSNFIFYFYFFFPVILNVLVSLACAEVELQVLFSILKKAKSNEKRKIKCWDFLAVQWLRCLYSQCKGPRFDAWLGN